MTDSSQPVVSRTYLIFFAPYSDRLSDRGRAVVHQLATVRTRLGDEGEVIAVGHEDSPEGKAGGDLDLRRAATVRNELIAEGVAPQAVTLLPRGAAELLVPTDEPEPQNRNVSFLQPGAGQSTDKADRRACAEWLTQACLPAAPAGTAEACAQAVGFLAR